MTDKEMQSILDELNSVRPEKLNGKARKLFDTIMQIIDERDDIKAELHAEKIKNKEQQKIIEVMGEWISDFWTLGEDKDSKEEVIQHFYKKVEEE